MGPCFRHIGLEVVESVSKESRWKMTPCGRLTEVSGVRVEHGQANKLLYNLWPTRNNESNQVATLENSPYSFVRVLLCKNALLRDGCSHDFLEGVSMEAPNNVYRNNLTSCSWTS
jgi:hypothetical protein